MIKAIHSSIPTDVSSHPNPEHFSSVVYGGKGASLMTLASMGIPVPLGFILPIGYAHAHAAERAHGYEHPETEHSHEAYRASSPLISPLPQSIATALKDLEAATGQRLGDPENPLFISVRSGGAISMPGMMDTFLNIGLTPDTCPALARRLGWSLSDARALYQACQENWSQYWSKNELPPSNTHDAHVHLWQAIQAVWQSANSMRAVAYKKHCGLEHTPPGSAVIIQCMVFGNASGVSGTGVVFTRNPDTGEDVLFGEFLPHAQGEAIVSGSTTPLALSELLIQAPKIFEELSVYAKKLEAHLGDMQDIEFTFENNTLWILQTRSGKRTAQATFRMAYDRVKTGQTTKEKALLHITPNEVDALLYPHLKDAFGLKLIGQGLPTSSGAAIGHLTTNIQNVTPDSILICNETSAEDVPAMLMARGVITLRGGMTSHAAVIMRGIGKPCISALENAVLTPDGLRINDTIIPTGTYVTMDGGKGMLFQGQGTIQTPTFTIETQSVLSWADALRRMHVYANADTPGDVTLALKWGADGIGLCRSEHMMFGPENLRAMQQFILAPNPEFRETALNQLEDLHSKDLLALLQAGKNTRFVLRLLDPPLHEFLPTSPQEKAHLAELWAMSLEDISMCIAEKKEINPMMGMRGCRLGLAFPQLYTMQIRAFFKAIDSVTSQGMHPECGIMVPLVSDFKELQSIQHLYQDCNPGNRRVSFGVMIETPRAALIADQLASLVDFISFGTNDLTQMSWGLSRDDSGPITSTYRTLGIEDPFSIFDAPGVGELIQWACARAKKANPNIQLSVCGEHASCPETVGYFQAQGIHALSCAPWALPRIRLAAAQASVVA